MAQSDKVPAGVVANLPVWECSECDGWQPALNETGDVVRPRACKDCGPGQRYRSAVGWCSGYRPIVVALAAKGWRFSSDVRKWAGVAEVRAA